MVGLYEKVKRLLFQKFLEQNLIGQTLSIPFCSCAHFLNFSNIFAPQISYFNFFESVCYRAMESISSSSRDDALLPSRILIVFDATKNRSSREFRHIIHNLRMWVGIVHPGDTIMVLGVVHRVLHPMGYQMAVVPDNFLGTIHTRAIEEEVMIKIDMYSGMLQYSAEECEEEGVDIEVKITAGTPIRKVVIQEVATSNVAWVIFDRHLRSGLKFYLKHIPCKVALVRDNLLVDILRPCYSNKELEYVEIKQFYSLSRPVPLPVVSYTENKEQSVAISDNGNNEQSVVTISYHGSLPLVDSSDMSKSSLISSVTSKSKKKSFSLRAKYGSNPKQEDSGLERDSSGERNRETFCLEFIYRYLRKSVIKLPRTGKSLRQTIRRRQQDFPVHVPL